MPTNISIVGNLCEDPQTRVTSSGMEIVEARIASSEGKDKTTFWTAKFFGNKAGEILAQYAKKGSGVMISGSTEEETWEKDGQKRSKMVCIAHSFGFIGGGKQEDKPAPAAGNKPPTRSPAKKSSPAPEAQEEWQDDVPF